VREFDGIAGGAASAALFRADGGGHDAVATMPCLLSEHPMRPLLVLLLMYWSVAARAEPAGRAEALFAAFGPAVVQVRVIDEASGDRVAIGSGFQVDASGVLATNFHVIAEVASQPGRYRLEYLADDESAVALELVDVDVIHDLAVLRAARPLAAVLPLSARLPAQGERLWSIGNPLDLAMTIIEGTYNGFVDGARYRRILFSASLNPGMSGGPALDTEGRVVGINVAHGGEQISFLVPAEYLAALLARAREPARLALDLEARIGDAILRDQDAWFAGILAEPWSSQRLGGFLVPGRIGPGTRCWGGSEDEAGQRYQHLNEQCGSDDTVYIEPELETGALSYSFHAFSSEKLNSLQFYGLMAAHFAHEERYESGDERQYGNFRCREDFLRGHGLDWRVSFCARRYRRFEGLYDVSVALATTELRGHGLVAQLGIDGISEERARVFLRRFVEAIEWQP
jgi:hypothetical protein